MGSSLSNLTPNADSSLQDEYQSIIIEVAKVMQVYDKSLLRLASERETINHEYETLKRESRELAKRLDDTKNKLTNKDKEIESLRERRNRIDCFAPILASAQSGTWSMDSFKLLLLKMFLQSNGINITGSQKTENANIINNPYIANSDNKRNNEVKGGNDNV